jgi:alkane 1-monooxygenase
MMKTLRYCIPFLFLASVLLGFRLGGAWSFLPAILVPACIAAGDRLFGAEAAASDSVALHRYRLLPWLYIPLQIAMIGWAAAMVAAAGTGSARVAGLTLSVGLTAGIFGLLAAHEMVHSRQRAERALGLAMLASVGYMHFRIAHIEGHHRRAATHEDPATARRGESAYRFVLRSTAGQLAEAWRLEAARLGRRRQALLGPANRMLRYLAIEALVACGVALLGPGALLFWIAQSALAILLLELFNYIAHYGLVRRAAERGGLEPLAPLHSWNCSRRMNNWALFNMGRHSDHHRFPARPYQRLAAAERAPELPTGYAGCILLALLPPLWRRIMDRRLACLPQASKR